MKVKDLYKGEVDILETEIELIILGSPDSELYKSHNCDTMGCSSVSHVLLRMPKTNILGLPKIEATQ